ncbi:hypothetical protein A0H81_06167 [Grifola frondosa]|uniref:Xylanolytic transcriptional activator regulatory domain-containing protein n=1 Tax=Grifola frondosa TaxID=5627 RepID=A0A1C7MAU4_GRIFR|nr:hypothetical protein A0H81_06167 [Grifola frondosa]
MQEAQNGMCSNPTFDNRRIERGGNYSAVTENIQLAVSVSAPIELETDEVIRLEGRIAELTSGTSSLALHDPYAQYHQTQPSQSSRSDALQNLVRGFLRYASEFGFFLHIPRFVAKVSSPPASDHPPAFLLLLNVIYLMGAKLSDNAQLQARQQGYLTEALQQLPSAMLDLNSVAALYVIQAEVLLANYFFDSNRQLEGAYHANAAVSIVMACQLHLMRSSRRRVVGEAATYRIPTPVDAIDEGERINAFWTVFVLDRSWAVALGSAPAFTDDEASGTQIDTPWPLAITSYQNHPIPSGFRGMRTVKTFVDGAVSDNGSQSILAMLAKAVVLYECAARLATKYNPSDQTNLLSLDNRIERFKQTLPGIDRVDASRQDVLHTPVVRDWVTANSRTLQAATSAARLLQTVNLDSLKLVNPFMGMLWTSIAQIISQGISTGRRLRASHASTSASALPNERMLSAALDQLAAAMEQSGNRSPLMRTQIRNMKRSPSMT